MVTAFASIGLAIDAMKLGASDFARKPMTPDGLSVAVAPGGAFWRLQAERRLAS
jgi:FixJ family two-component response regulator